MAPKLRDALRSLARGEGRWPLYLWGATPGAGKTSAALVMLDHYGPPRRTGFSAEVSEFMHGFGDFASLPELFRAAEQKQHYFATPAGCDVVHPSNMWTLVRDASLFVLDDLRKPSDREQRLGDDHYGLLKRILDVRVGRPLIITSNVCPWEPEGKTCGSELVQLFDDRIADRIVCGTVFKLGGPTRRSE